MTLAYLQESKRQTMPEFSSATRLEIISDVVSEKTDVVSVFPMWYRNFSATCLSDTTSEIISNRAYSYILKPLKKKMLY